MSERKRTDERMDLPPPEPEVDLPVLKTPEEIAAEFYADIRALDEDGQEEDAE